MKITNNQINQLQALYAQQTKGHKEHATDGAGRTGKKDQLVLSDRAKEIQLALKTAQTALDLREEKVQAIKEQIERGTYQVPALELAKAMLNRTPNE